MNSDSHETIATTHHSTLRLDNIQERQQSQQTAQYNSGKQHSTIPETLPRCVMKWMHVHVTNSDSNDRWSHLLNLYMFRCSCFSLFRSDVSLTSLRLWDSCNEVLAQPSRQRLKVSGALLAVVHVVMCHMSRRQAPMTTAHYITIRSYRRLCLWSLHLLLCSCFSLSVTFRFWGSMLAVGLKCHMSWTQTAMKP